MGAKHDSQTWEHGDWSGDRDAPATVVMGAEQATQDAHDKQLACCAQINRGSMSTLNRCLMLRVALCTRRANQSRRTYSDFEGSKTTN